VGKIRGALVSIEGSLGRRYAPGSVRSQDSRQCFSNVRLPLHDHVKSGPDWVTSQWLAIPTTGLSLKAVMVSSVMFEVCVSALFVISARERRSRLLSFPQSSVEAPKRPRTTARSNAEPFAPNGHREAGFNLAKGEGEIVGALYTSLTRTLNNPDTVRSPSCIVSMFPRTPIYNLGPPHVLLPSVAVSQALSRYRQRDGERFSSAHRGDSYVQPPSGIPRGTQRLASIH
jgi:hypothetical protein